MAQTNRKPLQTALVYGLVSGVALGASEVTLFLVMMWTSYSGLGMLLGRLAPVLLVLAYLYAGYNAARGTANLFAGTLAGALTGVFGVLTVLWLAMLIGSFMHMYVPLDPQLMGIPFSLSTTAFTLMLSPLVQVMLSFAVYGAIVGTIGGYVGKRRALAS